MLTNNHGYSISSQWSEAIYLTSYAVRSAITATAELLVFSSCQSIKEETNTHSDLVDFQQNTRLVVIVAVFVFFGAAKFGI